MAVDRLIKSIPVKKTGLAILLVVLLSAVFSYSFQSPPHTMGNDIELASASALLDGPVNFEQQVKPILEQRCVVCHGCYDAPCQLKLSSVAGLLRGASEERVYEPKRLGNMQPTRLFVDAKTTEEWRDRGFTPVLNEASRPRKIT